MSVRLLVLAAFVLLSCSGAFARSICVTPVGECEVADAPPQSECYCATSGGLVAGTVAASEGGEIPKFCCTPSGRFGPYENATAKVGESCRAKLPNGTTMTGQACF